MLDAAVGSTGVAKLLRSGGPPRASGTGTGGNKGANPQFDIDPAIAYRGGRAGGGLALRSTIESRASPVVEQSAGHQGISPRPQRRWLSMNEVTRILSAVEQGDSQAAEQLLPLVYNELRRLAAQRLAQEKPGQTLQATALVHDAYLRLVGGNGDQHWNSRGHFFAAAAEAMRRILVEQARRIGSVKHRGSHGRLGLDAASSLADESFANEQLALDEALSRLAEESLARAELLKLRFFVCLTIVAAGLSFSFARTMLPEQRSSPIPRILP